MKKIVTKTIAAIIMLSLMLTALGMQPVMAAASTASARDVYITGNFVEGQTLTAHYAYYDETGAEEVPENVKYQWYKFKDAYGRYDAISGATRSTYTIPESEVDNKQLFVEVTTANANGSGNPVYSHVYTYQAYNAAATTPVRVNPHMVFVSGDSYTPGTTLRAVAPYAQAAGAPITKVNYTWAMSDAQGGTYIKVGSGETFTISDEHYGKYLRLTVDYSATIDGIVYNSGTSYYQCIAHIGSLLGYNSSITQMEGFPTGCYSRIMTAMHPFSGTMYSYGNQAAIIKLDIGRIARFDGIEYILDKGKDVKVEYSVDESTWTEIEHTSIIGTHNDCSLEKAAEARYFRLSYTTTGNSTVRYFRPYLSTCEKEVTDILEGTPLDVVVESMTVPEGYTLSVRTTDGVEVENISDIRLTNKNCRNYNVIAAKDSAEIVYWLSCKGYIHYNDYSNADTTKIYTNNAIDKTNIRNIPGMLSTYWYFNDSEELTNDKRANGQFVEEAGNKLLKFSANGTDKTGLIFAKMNYQYGDLSTTGIYSYSTKLKHSENAVVNLTAKIGTINKDSNGVAGVFVKPGLVRFSGNELYIADVLAGSCTPGEWYEVECMVDYNQSKIAVFIDGVKYTEVAIADNAGQRNYFSPVIEIGSNINEACTDVVYFDYISVKQVYDMESSTVCENKEYKLTMSADTLEGGATYTAAANVEKIVPYLAAAAVIRETYADDEQSTLVSSELVNVFTMKDGAIGGIKMPESISENYESGKLKSKVKVILLAWDSELNPIQSEAITIE